MPLFFFILALDSVYRVNQERGDICGVPLASERRTADFKISDDADDTAIYLRDRSAVLSAVTILDDFSSILGLQTNQAKSIIIELDPRGSSMSLDTCGLNLRLSTRYYRYLSVLVGQHDAIPANSSYCIRSLWSRLLLARAKTHTVEPELGLLAPSRCQKLST